LISAPGAFLNAAGAAITPVMMFAHFSPSVSGQFAVVQSAVGLPVAMIVASISQVYVAHLSQHLRDRDVRAIDFANRVTAGTALIALSALFLIPFFPGLFAWAFGESWRVAGRFAQLLAPAYGVALVYGAMNSSLLAMGRYKAQLAWDSAWPLSFGLVWVIVVVFRLSPEWAVGFHALAICALGASFLTLFHILLRRYDFQGGTKTQPRPPDVGEPGALI
jgi:O-antigen/teichoic acid export membrane protein